MISYAGTCIGIVKIDLYYINVTATNNNVPAFIVYLLTFTLILIFFQNGLGSKFGNNSRSIRGQV